MGLRVDNRGMTVLTADEIERRVAHLAQFEGAQGHVRRRFDLPERDEGALRRVAEVYNPPAWAAGCISMHDAMFLYDLVRGIRPRRMIEVGVASGASSALLLRAMADAGLAGSGGEGGVVQSFELHPFCYFDRSKRVGCLVEEQAGDVAGLWELHVPGTAREAGRLFRKEKVALAFIDADHRHPAPTADLLWLLPALADGAWVALHDIDLPNVALSHEKRTGEKVNWHDRGAKALFDGWPFEKIRGGTVGEHSGGTNIGAIRVPAGVTARDLRHVAIGPWEVEPDREMKKVLGL
jgi:predicted O-methyltransferase YrrM